MDNGKAFTASELEVFEAFANEHIGLSLYNPDVDREENRQSSINLVLASVREHFKLSFKTVRKDGQRFRLYPAYINDLRLNAFASKTEALNLCGVNIGFAAAVYELAMFCFAQKNTFLDIGDVSLEAGTETIGGYPPGFWMRSHDAALENEEFIEKSQAFIPNDAARSTAATVLGIFMLRYVWFHELYHCLNGHTALVQDKKMALFLHETGKSSFSPKDSEHMQCMELDADQSAFYACCKIQIDGLENIDGMEQFSLGFRLRMNILAAYMTTWLIEEHNRRDEKESDDDHPEPYLRLHNLIRALASNVASEVSDVTKISDRVFGDLAAISAIIPSMPSADSVLSDMTDPEIQGKLDRFGMVLTKLRGDLKPYQYI